MRPTCNNCGMTLAPARACVICAPLARAALPRVPVAVERTIALTGTLLLVALAVLIDQALHPAMSLSRAIGVSLVSTTAITTVVGAWAIASRRSLWTSLAHAGCWWWYPVAAGLGLTTFAFASLCINAVSGSAPTDWATLYSWAGLSWPLTFLITCLQPALCEELAFRGLMQRWLRAAAGRGPALLITAALFALLHLNAAALPHLLLMGLALGYIRDRSGSLYPCILLHVIHNSLVMLG